MPERSNRMRWLYGILNIACWLISIWWVVDDIISSTVTAIQVAKYREVFPYVPYSILEDLHRIISCGLCVVVVLGVLWLYGRKVGVLCLATLACTRACRFFILWPSLIPLRMRFDYSVVYIINGVDVILTLGMILAPRVLWNIWRKSRKVKEMEIEMEMD